MHIQLLHQLLGRGLPLLSDEGYAWQEVTDDFFLSSRASGRSRLWPPAAASK